MRTYYYHYFAATALVLALFACVAPKCHAASYWGGGHEEDSADIMPVSLLVRGCIKIYLTKNFWETTLITSLHFYSAPVHVKGKFSFDVLCR